MTLLIKWHPLHLSSLSASGIVKPYKLAPADIMQKNSVYATMTLIINLFISHFIIKGKKKPQQSGLKGGAGVYYEQVRFPQFATTNQLFNENS